MMPFEDPMQRSTLDPVQELDRESAAGSSLIECISSTIRDFYGIDGVLSRLPGENLNYLVSGMGGQKYVAKIAGDELPPFLVDLQSKAIQHARERANLAPMPLEFPMIIGNLQHHPETGVALPGIGYKRLRILSFIEGINLSEIPDISNTLAFELGCKLAGFTLCMVGFDHTAAMRHHRWNLANAEQHVEKLAMIEDPEKRSLLSWAFGQWTNRAYPVLPELPWQFIHGDFNPENIRVRDGRIVGLLDFDDACRNPAICELAICLAYQMMDQADPWEIAGKVIAGYESVRPITANERAVLLPLVCGRLAVSISVSAERRRIDSTNANWFVSEKPAWHLLSQVRASGYTNFPAH